MTADERISALEAKLDKLQAQLANRPQRDSMQGTLTCPACGCGRILVVRAIHEHTGQGVAPLTLGTSHTWAMLDGDPLHAFVCSECRLVEWRVKSLEHLVPDGENVKLLERAPSAAEMISPYR